MSTIRLATPDDAAAVAAIYAPYVLETPISFEIVPPDAEEMRRRIERVTAAFPWLVLEAEGAVRGYAYAGRFRERAAYDWSCEVSVYVDAAHHRAGAGRTLYTALLALVRRLGYYTAIGGITLPNEASVGLHHAMGFRDVAAMQRVGFKGGRWWDVAYLELDLQDAFPDQSAPPMRIGDLSADEVAAVLASAQSFR